MVCPLIHVLILLEMVNLLILTVSCAHSLLAVSDSFLEKDTARALHILSTILASFMHMLEIMRLRHSLRLPYHGWSNILILSSCSDTLIGHVSWCLYSLAHTEFEQLFDILWGHLGRCALTNLNDLALWIIV